MCRLFCWNTPEILKMFFLGSSEWYNQASNTALEGIFFNYFTIIIFSYCSKLFSCDFTQHVTYVRNRLSFSLFFYINSHLLKLYIFLTFSLHVQLLSYCEVLPVYCTSIFHASLETEFALHKARHLAGLQRCNQWFNPPLTWKYRENTLCIHGQVEQAHSHSLSEI